jgi:predicted nucleic acid-binding protein
MIVAALVDTNVLVYRYDPRDREKQRLATQLLREGSASNTVRLPHQAIIEFVSATSKPLAGGRSLLPPDLARQEADELLSEFTVLFPNKGVVRTALRGAAMYGLSCFDAHLWAYAEYYGLNTLLSEDFQPGRIYGSVRIIDPFLAER